MYLEGRLQTREYTTQDGQKRSRTEITAENMIILDRAGGTGSGASSMGNGAHVVWANLPWCRLDRMIRGWIRGWGTKKSASEDIPF